MAALDKPARAQTDPIGLMIQRGAKGDVTESIARYSLVAVDHLALLDMHAHGEVITDGKGCIGKGNIARFRGDLAP